MPTISMKQRNEIVRTDVKKESTAQNSGGSTLPLAVRRLCWEYIPMIMLLI